jgi:hypothetical protein
MLRREFLAALPSGLVLLGSRLRASEEGSTPRTPPANILSRVAVIGASVSRGLSSGIPLAALLEHAILTENEEVAQFADARMGLTAPGSGEKQVDDVLDHEATLVVALDFLFWYAHFLPAGRDPDKTRIERFEGGLAQLDRIAAPFACGDIPAMDDVPVHRLPKEAVPSPEIRDELNSRLRAFCAKRERVLLLPLANWVEELRVGKWKIAGSLDGKATETPITAEKALHADRMHPTTLGALALGDRVVAALRERHRLLAREFSFDVWKALRKLAPQPR